MNEGPRGDRGATGARGKQGLPWSIRYAIVSLFILAVLLAAASTLVAVRAVQGEIGNRASVTQLCQSGNDARAQQVTLWTHLIAISPPPPGQTAAQQQARAKLIRDFLGFVHKVFAARNCGG